MGLWRRKQSTSSSGSSNLSGTVTPVSSEEQELHKTPSRLAKTFGVWSSKPKKAKPSPEDPRLNRPFTRQNLEHQAIFENFAFSFGRRRKSSHGGRSTMSGVSPSASRNASVDSTHMPPSSIHQQHHGDRRETHPKFSNSLAKEAPQEVPGEETDRDIRDHLTIATPGPPFDTLATQRLHS